MIKGFKAKKCRSLLAIATLMVVITWQSLTLAADRIDFNYSLLGFRVIVPDLVDFAQTGKISRHLNFYLKRISPETRKELQEFLRQSYEIDPILVYRYSRTSVGIKLLKRIGEIIQLPGGINGFHGLRATMVETAISQKGVSLINFLDTFPTNIYLNLPEIFNLVKQISDNEQKTREFIANFSENRPKKNQTKVNNFTDFSQPGKYLTTQQTLTFYDARRDRLLNTDLYLPQSNLNSIPLIVVSNGLGAKRDRFKELAQHLASYGFAVVIPDHPGSDRARQKTFLKGLYRENFAATDFIDRPLDISYILDELALFNRKQVNNRLDLQRVGIFGYSIGGTTALALAGAKIDLPYLQRECTKPLDLLNISILYQCRALELSPAQPSLKDERIKAAFLFVPFGNSLYSRKELKQVSIPMFWQVVDQDFLTSLLTEQIPLFKSLVNSDRYLTISEKIPHSNVTLSKEQQSEQGKIFQVAKNYQNILSLVFFQNYVAKNQDYQQYLTTQYLKAIEQQPYKLHINYQGMLR